MSSTLLDSPVRGTISVALRVLLGLIDVSCVRIRQTRVSGRFSTVSVTCGPRSITIQGTLSVSKEVVQSYPYLDQQEVRTTIWFSVSLSTIKPLFRRSLKTCVLVVYLQIKTSLSPKEKTFTPYSINVRRIFFHSQLSGIAPEIKLGMTLYVFLDTLSS